MKIPASLLSIIMAAGAAIASESSLTKTYQPLNALGAGGIAITQVTCHRWHGHSTGSAVDLIHLRNIPPTDNPDKATDDLNLASLCGLKFSTNDLGAVQSVPMILLDTAKFDDSNSGGIEKTDIVRASLERLRRCLPEKLKTTEVTLKCAETDREWLSKIVSDFNAAPKHKPFYESP